MSEPSSCSVPLLEVHWKMTSCLCLQMDSGHLCMPFRVHPQRLLLSICSVNRVEQCHRRHALTRYIMTSLTTGQVRGMATRTAQSTYLEMSVPQRPGCKHRASQSPCAHRNPHPQHSLTAWLVTQNHQALVCKGLRQETFVLGKQRGIRDKPVFVPDQAGPALCFAL